MWWWVDLGSCWNNFEIATTNIQCPVLVTNMTTSVRLPPVLSTDDIPGTTDTQVLLCNPTTMMTWWHQLLLTQNKQHFLILPQIVQPRRNPLNQQILNILMYNRLPSDPFVLTQSTMHQIYDRFPLKNRSCCLSASHPDYWIQRAFVCFVDKIQKLWLVVRPNHYTGQHIVVMFLLNILLPAYSDWDHNIVDLLVSGFMFPQLSLTIGHRTTVNTRSYLNSVWVVSTDSKYRI